jgi:hypothetical protein
MPTPETHAPLTNSSDAAHIVDKKGGLMPRVRSASVSLVVALMLAFAPQKAGAEVHKIVEETTSTWLIEGRELGNLTEFGTWIVRSGTLWETDMNIDENPDVPVGQDHTDHLTFDMRWAGGPIIQHSSWHIVPPHGEGENANRAMASLFFDAKTEYKGGMWTAGTKAAAGSLPHGSHWDLFVLAASVVVAPAFDIMSYDWLVFGKHTSKTIIPISFFAGHVDDGTTTTHLGTIVGVADTADSYVDVAGIVEGISPSDVVSASVRAGPSGPIITNVPLQSMADDQGNLTIDAHFLFFDPSARPSLNQQAYLELVTTQGVIGGSLARIGSSGLLGIEGPDLPTRVELQAPYPNPANRGISIRYAIPASLSHQTVGLAVYDIFGRRVRTIERGRVESGDITRTFDLRGDDGRRLGNGLYFLTLRVGAVSTTRKLAIVD